MEILRQSEQWPDRTAAIQAAQEHHLQDPHYDDYGPEENDWEAQRGAEDAGPDYPGIAQNLREHQRPWHGDWQGFPLSGGEHEVDTTYDPDHGREDRFGAQNVHRLDYPGDPDDIVPGSPQDHAQHVAPSFSPYDSGGSSRDWDPNTGYQPSAHDEHMSELAADDDDSGYNWGPPPQEHYGYTGDGQTEDELATSHPMQHHDDIQIMRGKDTGLYGEDEDHPQDIIGQPNSHGGFDVIRHL
jgi:hypothetical protein